MKNFLFALFIFSSLPGSGQGLAFIEAGTLEGSGSSGDFSINVTSHLVNNSDVPLDITWQRIEVSLPEEWSTQICDIQQCYLAWVPSESFFLGVGDTAPLKVQFKPQGVAGSGEVDMFVSTEINGSPVTLTKKFLATAHPFTGIADLNSDMSVISFYPNPVINEININFYDSRAQTIEIFNLTGRKIKSLPVINSLMSIDVSQYSAGMYFLSIKDNLGNILDTRRFSKKG